MKIVNLNWKWPEDGVGSPVLGIKRVSFLANCQRGDTLHLREPNDSGGHENGKMRPLIPPEQGHSTGSCCASLSQRIHSAPRWESFPWGQDRLRLTISHCSHLNLGRKGTSSSKDKKLNWTVEARWNKKLKNIPRQKSTVRKISLGKNIGYEADYTRDWFILVVLCTATAFSLE